MRARAGNSAGYNTYDGQIIACSVKAGAKTLLTFNLRHFESLAQERIAIRSP